MKNFEKISNKLNELLEKNYDAEKGYIHAMQNVDSDRLKAFFKERAEERSRFAMQIRTQILTYGEDPTDSGSFSGKVHRNWMSLKTLFSSNDEEAILEETIKGEKKSIEEYNEALKLDNLPTSIETMLASQRNTIQNVVRTAEKLESLVS
ncbi:MAG: PA2169 family four-helix-bundle protein [Flavobacteriaceae bacterium]|nr:PA2169 family four-helix-bundle protein [Flavobacteriaceae bacterium]